MQKYHFIIIFMIGFGILPAFSQLNDANWMMGLDTTNDTINFGIMRLNLTDSAVIEQEVFFNPIDIFLDNTSYSDEAGDLLIFTNGTTFYNENGNVFSGLEDIYPDDGIEGGFTLYGNTHFLDDPNRENSFYFISGNLFVWQNPDLKLGHDRIIYYRMEYEKGIDSFDLFIAEDRSLVVMDTLSDERTACTRHANGRDWWILLNYHRSNEYKKILLTPEGFIDYGNQIIGDSTVLGIDQPTFSPDGQYYGAYSLSGQVGGASESNIEYMEFDRCTGELSNYNKFLLNSNGGLQGGISFSANGRFLYASVTNDIFQFDLVADDVEGSKINVATYDGFTYLGPDSMTMLTTRFNMMQNAPNGKIYVSVPGNGRFLHVINHPDSLGLSCDVQQHAVELPRFYRRIIPNYPNYRLGPLSGSPCDTLAPFASFIHEDTDTLAHIRFTDQSSKEPTSWLWDFGDGTSSTEQNPFHTYLTSGTYEVCLRVENRFGTDSICQQVPVIFTSTESLVDQSEFKLFPNPTRDYFGVQGALEIEEVEVFASDGKLLLTSLERQVFIGDLSSGLYLVKVRFENGQVGFGKVVRE